MIAHTEAAYSCWIMYNFSRDRRSNRESHLGTSLILPGNAFIRRFRQYVGGPGAGSLQLRIVVENCCDCGKSDVRTGVIQSSKNTTVAVADESLITDMNSDKS
jgi:hypothetical protein